MYPIKLPVILICETMNIFNARFWNYSLPKGFEVNYIIVVITVSSTDTA